MKSVKRKFSHGASNPKRAKFGTPQLRPRNAVALNPIPRFPAYFADLPKQKYAKLKYVVHETHVGPGAAAPVYWEYRANGMYDPEVAVGGHQPYGFDQLCTQYDHWTVLKSVMEIEVTSLDQYRNIIIVGAQYNESGCFQAAYTSGGINGLRELPNVSMSLCPSVGHFQERARNQYLTCDVSKLSGKTYKNLIGDSRYQGSSAADPTEDFYFGLCMYSPYNADMTAYNIGIKVQITYFAVFTEPRTLVTS